MRADQVGVVVQSQLEVGPGFLQPSELVEGESEVVVGYGGIVLDRQGFTEELDRFLELALLDLLQTAITDVAKLFFPGHSASRLDDRDIIVLFGDLANHCRRHPAIIHLRPGTGSWWVSFPSAFLPAFQAGIVT